MSAASRDGLNMFHSSLQARVVCLGPVIHSVVAKDGHTLATAGGGKVIVNGLGFGAGAHNQLLVKIGNKAPSCNLVALISSVDRRRLIGTFSG
jgi:hypothetical protein